MRQIGPRLNANRTSETVNVYVRHFLPGCPVSEMTYTVSSGSLNSTILYYSSRLQWFVHRSLSIRRCLIGFGLLRVRSPHGADVVALLYVQHGTQRRYFLGVVVSAGHRRSEKLFEMHTVNTTATRSL